MSFDRKSLAAVIAGVLLVLLAVFSGFNPVEPQDAPPIGSPVFYAVDFVYLAAGGAVEHGSAVSEVFRIGKTSGEPELEARDFEFHYNAYYGSVTGQRTLVWETWNETVFEQACVDEEEQVMASNGSIITLITRNCTESSSIIAREGWREAESFKELDLVRVELTIQPEILPDGSLGYAVWTYPCVEGYCNYEATWFNTSFASYLNCTVNTTVDSNLTDFPVRCEIANSVLDSECYALRAVNRSDNAFLDYEVEGGTCQTGENATVWVKLPTAYGTGYEHLNEIHLYYNNNTLVSDASNGSAVFSNNYSAVWHMGDANDSVIHDSTGDNWFNWSGGGSQNVTSLDCQFGNCTRFNTTVWGDINNLNTNYPTTADTGVVSAWVYSYTDVAAQFVLCKSDTVSANNGNGLRLDPDRFMYSRKVGALTGGRQNSTQSVVGYGEMRYYAIQADGANDVMLRVNSTQVPTTIYLQDTGANFHDLGNEWKIGTFFRSGTTPPSTTLNGVLDELRLHNINRSDDWLKAEFAQTWLDAGTITAAPLIELVYPPTGWDAELSSTFNLTAQCETNETDETIVNTTHWVYYENGSIYASQINTSAVSDSTNVSYEVTMPAAEYDFEWNFECVTATLSANASSNHTLNASYFAGNLTYYPVGTSEFGCACTGFLDYNLLKTPTNQSNVTPIMVFNNTGNGTGSLDLTVNATPYNLEFYASQDDNYSNAIQVTTGNTTINSSVPAGQDVLLWWWVNCSNSTGSSSEQVEVNTLFGWWLK